MSAQGGGNRMHLKPMPSDPAERIGSHMGTTECLNITNPQPGFHYYHARRDASSIQRKLNEGWRPVTGEDPESWGVDLTTLDGTKIPELDGLRAFQDVILVKIPEDKYAALQVEKERRAKVQRTGTTEEYLSKGQELASRIGSSEDELYYARRNHEIREE